jgi:hypothetical protein
MWPRLLLLLLLVMLLLLLLVMLLAMPKGDLGPVRGMRRISCEVWSGAT